MWNDCSDAVKRCLECLKFNVGGGGYHPAKTTSAGLPWDHIVWDLIGQFDMSGEGYNFVLIIVDVLIRFVVLKPLRTKSASEIANRLVETFANFGVLKILQTDNDRALVNETMEQIRGMAGFQFRKIMAYFPRQNGPVERFVGEMKALLKKVIKGDMDGWECFIPAVQMALNDRVLTRHDSCPFSLMYGRRMNGFEDYRHVDWDEKDGKDWIENVQKWMEEVWEIISKKSKEVGEKQVEIKNKKNKNIKGKNVKRDKLDVGDIVMKKIMKKTKMGERWEGPFEVIEYNEDSGGYKIRERAGKVLKDTYPIEYLWLIDKCFEEEDRLATYEIEKVLDHRGNLENREYLVKWKDYKKNTWVKQERFNTTGCITDYWKSKKKGKEKEEKKENKNVRRSERLKKR